MSAMAICGPITKFNHCQYFWLYGIMQLLHGITSEQHYIKPQRYMHTMVNSTWLMYKQCNTPLTLYSRLWHLEPGWIVFSMSLGSCQVSWKDIKYQLYTYWHCKLYMYMTCIYNWMKLSLLLRSKHGYGTITCLIVAILCGIHEQQQIPV